MLTSYFNRKANTISRIILIYKICFFLHTDIKSTSNFLICPPIDVLNHVNAINNTNMRLFKVYTAQAGKTSLIHMKDSTSFSDVTVTPILEEKLETSFSLNWNISL